MTNQELRRVLYRDLGLAWTLVFLVGAGIGRWLLGVVRGRGELAASGGWLMAAGLVLVGRRLLAARQP